MLLFACGCMHNQTAIKGKVVNREGRLPVKGAKVVLMAGTEMSAVTSETGEFQITDIPLGTYSLVVTASTFTGKASCSKLRIISRISILSQWLLP